MKKLLFLLSLIPALAFGAPGNTNSTIPFAWDWAIPQTGGMPTNQFLTNYVFVLYSTTNIASPTWAQVTNYPAATTWTGTNQTFYGQLPAPATPTTFYALTASTTGGESPFSNTALWTLPGSSPALHIFKP